MFTQLICVLESKNKDYTYISGTGSECMSAIDLFEIKGYEFFRGYRFPNPNLFHKGFETIRNFCWGKLSLEELTEQMASVSEVTSIIPAPKL